MDAIGSWSKLLGLRMNVANTKFQKRYKLDGLIFHSAITIPKLPPNKTFIEHIDSDDYPYFDNMSKSNYRVFQILMEWLNFSMVIRRSRNWGSLTSDGSWNGVVGLLNRTEIDISVSGL
ncbi:hypothetical protein Bhyg_12323, partial [Pseudolycoriella hygida]